MRIILLSLSVFIWLIGNSSCSFGQSLEASPANIFKDEADHANFLSIRAGARIHSCSSTDSANWMVQNILDYSTGPKGVWRTELKAKFPHWVVIELPRPTELTTFSFNTAYINESDFEGVSPNGIIIEYSTESPDSGYQRIAHEFLKKKKNNQIFSVQAATAKWIRISIRNNFGNPYLTEFGRVYAYNDLAINQYEMVLQSENQLDLHNILFESNSANIEEESIPIIESIAQIMLRNSNWKIVVEGHTDKFGDESYNKYLSKERAKNVVKVLENHGIDKNRLTFNGLGSSKPLANEDSEQAYTQNRRVTLRLSEK